MSDITVASTTDSQEDVSRAAGVPEEDIQKITEEVKATASKTTEPAKEEKPAGTEKAVEQKTTQPVKQFQKPKSPSQKRIDTLTGRNYALSTENENLRKRLEELERGGGKKETKADKPADQSATAKPKLEDFATHEEWVEALTKWTVEQTTASQRVSEQQAAENKRLEAVFTEFNKQLETARGKHEDYDEVVGAPDAQLLEAAQLAIMELDNGAEVAYFLAKNPEEREKINKMSNLKAVAYIGKLADKLPADEEAGEEAGEGEAAAGEGEGAGEDEAGGEAPAAAKPKAESAAAPAAAAPKKPVSKAPAPVTPVGGSGTKSAVPLDELPFSDYKKVREQQEQANRRR